MVAHQTSDLSHVNYGIFIKYQVQPPKILVPDFLVEPGFEEGFEPRKFNFRTGVLHQDVKEECMDG